MEQFVSSALGALNAQLGTFVLGYADATLFSAPAPTAIAARLATSSSSSRIGSREAANS